MINKIISGIGEFTRITHKQNPEEPWDLDKVLFYFEGIDRKGQKMKYPFTIRDSVQGVASFGEPGSGKSSSLESFVRPYLRAGYGFVFPTVKPGNAAQIKKIAEEEGRGDAVVIFSKESGLCMDPILYELSRPGRGAGSVTNIIDLLIKLNTMILQDGGKSGEDAQFWNNVLYRLLGRAINLLIMAGEKVSLKNIRKILEDAVSEDKHDQYLPVFKAYLAYADSLLYGDLTEDEQKKVLEELVDLGNKNYVINCLNKAAGFDDTELFDLVKSYFTKDFQNMADKTRASAIEMVYGIIEPFSTGILKDCFTGKVSEELLPEKTWEEGKIIILDFPIKEFNLIGRLAIGFYRFMWMSAIERRITDNSGKHRPVALIQDEAQEYIDPNGADTKFQSTSRESRVATITLSQSKNNFIVAFGSTMPEQKTKSLLGNLSTKVFFSQNDFDTNEYASRVIAEDKIDKISKSISADNMTTNTTEEYQAQIRPIEFARLKTGGPKNNFEVEAYVTKAGKFQDWFGTNVFKATFHQNH